MTEVRVQRTIAAPPARVYRAWLEPEVMQRWFAPAGFRCAAAEVDERVGGRLRIWHRDDENDMGGAEGEITELVPDERIVLRWWFVGPDRRIEPQQETRLTITFAPAGAGATAVTVTHDRLDGLAETAPEIAGGIQPGWTTALESLTTALETQS